MVFAKDATFHFCSFVHFRTLFGTILCLFCKLLRLDTELDKIRFLPSSLFELSGEDRNGTRYVTMQSNKV